MKYLKKYEEIKNRLIFSNKWKGDLSKFVTDCLENFDDGSRTIVVNKEFNNGTLCVLVERKHKYSINVYFDARNGKRRHSSIENLSLDRLRELCYMLLDKFYDYDFQKEFLIKTPNNAKKLELVGIHPKIAEEYDYLFNADDMGLL